MEVNPDNSLKCINNAYIWLENGKIKFIGDNLTKDTFQNSVFNEIPKYNCNGKIVTPGLIDCHTHIIYAGNRSFEWQKRLHGATYKEIAEAGGGIVNTVKATRAYRAANSI
jgi:imidazolonepropionase